MNQNIFNPLPCTSFLLISTRTIRNKRLFSTTMAGLAFFLFLLLGPVCDVSAQAETVEYHLTIAKQQLNITGHPAEAMTINGGVPGPVLHFTEGDTALIHVRNDMEVNTSIHWHGILVPPGMDGVPFISFPPIAPGTTFTYEFPIRQSGTYWYHSHTRLQEQSGVYGAIVIEPRTKTAKTYGEHVVLFSDWTDDNPEAVNRTLKRGSEWFALEKGSGQSILGAARIGMLGSYLQREFTRMPPMDIADVAYDRFLANGKVEEEFAGNPGETIRLRIVNGSSTTFFHLEFAGGPMTIVAADGIDVQPVHEKRLLIAVAETYDVLLTVPSSGAYEFRATAHDGSAFTSVWIGQGERHPAPDVPKPNMYHRMHHTGLAQALSLTPAGTMGMPDDLVNQGKFDAPGMAGMDQGMSGHGMKMETDHAMPGMGKDNHTMPGNMADMEQTDSPPEMQMDHGMKMQKPDETGTHARKKSSAGHQMQAQQTDMNRSGKKYAANFGFLAADIASRDDLAIDGMSDERPWPPYAKLKALKPTSFNPDRKVREIRLTLDGDMERYVWMLNNRALSESDSILIHEGEVVRFIMINRTMMHHPMHLHGHFFRVLTGKNDDFAPLKHTVDVAPMSTTVIEFDANEFGDWFFHCHLLYHMKAGMARMVHYDDFTIDPELAAVRPNLYHDPWYFWGEANILTNMTEGMLTLADTRNIIGLFWEAGWENVDQTEWEGILSWDRYFNRFFTLFAGIDLLGEDKVTDETRGFAGLHYLLPFYVESRFWIDTDGGFRGKLEKSFELTPRLSLMGEVEYDTHDLWEGKVGLSYMLNRNFSISAVWHSDFLWGAGLNIRF